MSFLDVDLEAQNDSFHNNIEHSKISLITTKASNLLTDLANGVSSLERLINQVGTKKDSTVLRQTIESIRIAELDQYKQQLEHLTNDISYSITNDSAATSADKFTEEKLRKEFQNINHKFNLLKRQYNEKKAYVVLNDSLANTQALNDESKYDSRVEETTPLISQQQQQQQGNYTLSQQELDVHTLLAEERASEIKRIHGGVEEINAIYKQLGAFVQEQGIQVDTVENNLSSLATQTQNASAELVKADNYQKKKRRWICVILFILVIFVLILVLAIFS